MAKGLGQAYSLLTAAEKRAWPWDNVSCGVLIRRHRADDTVSKAISKILRAELVVVDLCLHRDYAEAGRDRLVEA
jgi:hypothetical protein